MGALIDLTGKKFGRLTVLRRDEAVSKDKGAHWICQCECGNVKTVASSALRSGATQSCGCLNREIISGFKDIPDMIGKKFGRLTVIERHGTHVTKGGQRKPTWRCVCECGNEKIATGQDLKTGHVKSCGCMPTKKRGDGLIDLTGKRFGKLVVIERAEDYTYVSSNGHESSIPTWLCQCDCGNTVVCQGGNLRNGNATSCGCDRIASIGESNVSDFLDANDVKYLREYTFDDLRNKKGNLLRFDFAILGDDSNVIALVEYQGAQHYIECGSFGAYQRNYSDKIKRKYCEEHNIPLYEIRFDDDLTDSCNGLLSEIRKLQNEV